MLVTIIIFYILLRYILELDVEEVYKLTIVLCVVNLIPTIVYTIVSFSQHQLDVNMLLLMTLI